MALADIKVRTAKLRDIRLLDHQVIATEGIMSLAGRGLG